ncbi:hypothetical protein GUJ93_ZPchr0001g32860 [Zizania palustris]|uniref:Uncharacterized protein n=1 Tax=Zizania palustris TaxID=103762 RepID=A0A8J5S040_ZIZPA|nr:hypothetical protein GUJ93_ZPchr0001g32860 [Zizania palustris]
MALVVAGLGCKRERAVRPRLGRPLLALCCLLLGLCQARVSPGMEEGRVVYFEVGVAAAVRRVSSPAAGDGGDASTLPLPPPSGSGGMRMERLLRSVPSPGVGH